MYWLKNSRPCSRLKKNNAIAISPQLDIKHGFEDRHPIKSVKPLGLKKAQHPKAIRGRDRSSAWA